jgi:hypothetical protein
MSANSAVTVLRSPSMLSGLDSWVNTPSSALASFRSAVFEALGEPVVDFREYRECLMATIGVAQQAREGRRGAQLP